MDNTARDAFCPSCCLYYEAVWAPVEVLRVWQNGQHAMFKGLSVTCGHCGYLITNIGEIQVPLPSPPRSTQEPDKKGETPT